MNKNSKWALTDTFCPCQPSFLSPWNQSTTTLLICCYYVLTIFSSSFSSPAHVSSRWLFPRNLENLSVHLTFMRAFEEERTTPTMLLGESFVTQMRRLVPLKLAWLFPCHLCCQHEFYRWRKRASSRKRGLETVPGLVFHFLLMHVQRFSHEDCIS